MKKLALLLLLLGCSSKKDRQYLIDNKVISHYAGCIEGFMVTIRLDMYRRPKRLKTPEEAIEEIKAACNYQSMLFQAELENEFSQD